MEQEKRVKVYSLSTCPACKRVKGFLEAHGVTHDYIEVDLLDSGEQWLVSKELKKYNAAATFPTVVIEEVIKGPDEKRLAEALGIE